jgi:hypothetical protein
VELASRCENNNEGIKMNGQQDWILQRTIDKAREMAREHMPAWEGGFAMNVLESIEYLKAKIDKQELRDREARAFRWLEANMDSAEYAPSIAGSDVRYQIEALDSTDLYTGKTLLEAVETAMELEEAKESEPEKLKGSLTLEEAYEICTADNDGRVFIIWQGEVQDMSWIRVIRYGSCGQLSDYNQIFDTRENAEAAMELDE